MKIIFIGGLFPKERTTEFIKMSKGIIQFAADTFQWSFINGLDEYYDNVSIYTSPFLGSYPRTYKTLFVKSSNFFHNSKSKDYCIGFPTIPILNLVVKSIDIYSKLKKNENSTNPYILVYCVHTPFLLAAVRFKRKFPNSKICLIVPDLPQYMSSNTGQFYSFFKKIDLKIINMLVKKVDSFVFVTEYMKSQFDIGSRPWTIIEGMYDDGKFIKQENKTVANEIIILYSGTLDSRYGIIDLIEAFKSIPYSNYILWICGDGNMKSHVIEYSLKDERVKYFGQVSHTEILNLQQLATVLVNPRTSQGEYTKYSFPIKTMEYLASGKPCVMHHLPGIPNEYIEHLFIPEHENSKSLADKIIEVCNMDSRFLEEKCNKSKSFILNSKNPKIQILKLVEILKQL